MKNFLKESLKVIVLGGALLAFQALAITGPSAVFPGGNVPAHLNVGSVSQDKVGGLTAGSLGSRGGAYFATNPGSMVGIGTANPSPSQKLDVAGTLQTLGFKMPTGATGGKVLTSSDSSGLAAWRSATKLIQIEFAQGFRREQSKRGGAIVAISGPSSAFVPLDGVSAYAGSMFVDKWKQMDGVRCYQEEGWVLSGCWEARSASANIDLVAYPNGCITPNYRGEGKVELSIACIRIINVDLPEDPAPYVQVKVQQ